MKTKKKDQIVEEISRLIVKSVRRAKIVHRQYLEAIREDDLRSELTAWHERDTYLESARNMKNALLSYDEDSHWGGNLYKVRNRRRAREEAARCSK